MFIVLPTILENNLLEFSNKIKLASQLTKRIQIDVIDEGYSRKKTLFPEDWFNFIPVDLQIDLHLMVSHPIEIINQNLGFNNLLITAQFENLESLENYFNLLKKFKIRAGLAIDLPTDLRNIDKFYFKEIDQILLLAVKAGLSGQIFNNSVLDKIRYLRQICSYTAEIIIDGGINIDTAQLCLKSGASGVAVNTFVWQDFPNNLQKLQQLV